MLTKALLKYSVRKKQVYPKFIDAKKKDLLSQSDDLISLYEKSKGGTLGQLEDKLKNFLGDKTGALEGLNKLLNERLVFSGEEEVESIVEKRFSVVLEAQKLRQESLQPSPEAFYEELEGRLRKSISSLREEFYSDLPEYQKIENFQKISNENLLHRYNTALVQGLLLNGKSITITLSKSKGSSEQNHTLSLHRFLFRQIKFHRLLCEVLKDDEDCFSFRLSGPLSIFEQRQTYGMRFANFFPHLLLLPHWKLQAELSLKSNTVSLSLDETHQLKSHYNQTEAYLPKELLFFISSFNKKKSLWKADPAEHFINMGEKSYCFPDIVFKQEGGSTLGMELFHRWHHSQFLHRLKTLEQNKETALILGVCKHLLKKKEVGEAIERSKAKHKVFLFSDFPSSMKLIQFLENQEHGSSSQ